MQFQLDIADYLKIKATSKPALNIIQLHLAWTVHTLAGEK